LTGNHEELKALPPRKKRRGNALASLSGLAREMSRIYHAMKKGRMDHKKGRSLVWVLAQMRSVVEAQALEAIERRLAQLGTNEPMRLIEHGDSGSTDEARATH